MYSKLLRTGRTACAVVSFFTAMVAGAAPLGELANQMQPGQWRQLNAAGDASGLTSALFEANPGTIMGYLDKGKWDAVTRRVHFIGQGHNGNQKFIQYDDATNRWSELARPSWDTSPGTIGHGYQHNSIDPATGDLFYRKYNSTDFYRLNRATGQWVKLPSPSISAVGIAGGVEYFPEIAGLVYVGRSTVSVFTGGSWKNLYDANLSMGEYHNIAMYSPQHKVVYLGGGDGSRVLYRMTSTQSVVRIADAPINVAVASSVTTVDPVSGNLLVFSDSSTAYQYTPTSNSWSRLSMSGATPLGGGVADTVAIPISTYGVIMFVQGGRGSASAWLYKHSPSAAVPIDNTPPAVPAGVIVD
jgi:hypothetical protein